MVRHLGGEPHLQRSILLYCLGAPSASIMEPLASLAREARRLKQDDNVTAWLVKPDKTKTRKLMLQRHRSTNSMRAIVIARELRVLKMEDPVFKEMCARNVAGSKETEFALHYRDLIAKETGGTPSGIHMRMYMITLSHKGMRLRPAETLWARLSLSFGGLSYKQGVPTTKTQLRVADELSAALETYYQDMCDAYHSEM